MNTFSSLNIESKNLTGEKIAIEEIIDKEIEVTAYRIKDSKFSRGMCMHLQIKYENELRMVFTASGVLMEDIEKVPKDKFPITTTIVKIPFKDNKQWFLKFT